MKLPAFLYGTYGEVKKNGRRMVAQIRRGVPWAELAGEMIDTRDVPGLIFVDAAGYPYYGVHFFTFMPVFSIADARRERRIFENPEATLFEPALATLWGFMAMFCNAGLWVWPDENKKRFLQALVGYWDELDAEGPRYSTGVSTPERLWSLPTTIHYCLINLGLPRELSYAPLPPGGIRELVNLTSARLD